MGKRRNTLMSRVAACCEAHADYLRVKLPGIQESSQIRYGTRLRRTTAGKARDA